MIAHGGTGNRSHEAEALGGLGKGAQHRPGQRRVALLFDPRKEVVGYGGKVEPGCLGTLGIGDKILEPMLFRLGLVRRS